MDKKKISRFEFFKEVKNDLKQTAKELFIPIIEDDVDKVDRVVDEVIGVQWYSLGNIDLENFIGMKDFYINNQNIAVFSNGKKFNAVEKTCPDCHNILNWISYDEKLKCFNCDNEYYVFKEEKNSKLNYYSVKKLNDSWVIGLYKL